eukprot:1143470-Rhodomonas_salina.1
MTVRGIEVKTPSTACRGCCVANCSTRPSATAQSLILTARGGMARQVRAAVHSREGSTGQCGVQHSTRHQTAQAAQGGLEMLRHDSPERQER